MMAMIDPDLKEYLTVQFKSLSDKIENMRDMFGKDLDRHRGDIDDLYNKDRESKEKIRDNKEIANNAIEKIEAHLEEHNKNDGKKKFSVEIFVAISVAFIGTLISIISLLKS